MFLKSLIIFAFVASLGPVMAAPLGARNSCQGLIGCARYILGNGHPDLSRRLASFDGNNVTLSSSTPEEPTANPYDIAANPSSTISPVDPSSTPSANLSSTPPVNPFLPTLPANSSLSPTPTPSVDPSSSTPLDETPQPAEPPSSGSPVTITIISTVFVNSTNPPGSLPTQSLPPPDSAVSSSPPVDPSSSTPNTVPGSAISLSSTLSEPSGALSSDSSPAPTASPSIIELTQGVPSSSVPPNPAGQPTPSPTTGIIFLPPSGNGDNGSSP